MVAEISAKLDENPDDLESDGVTFKMLTDVGTLRNRSLAWIVRAFHDISKPDIVKKVCLVIFLRRMWYLSTC